MQYKIFLITEIWVVLLLLFVETPDLLKWGIWKNTGLSDATEVLTNKKVLSHLNNSIYLYPVALLVYGKYLVYIFNFYFVLAAQMTTIFSQGICNYSHYRKSHLTKTSFLLDVLVLLLPRLLAQRLLRGTAQPSCPMQRVGTIRLEVCEI